MIEKPRGTRDFSPEEMHKRNVIEQTMRSTFENFGYREIQTPTFENLELFKKKSGEEIINEIYDFKDKGGRELALRPELTAPVIRFYVEKLQMEPKPLKLFYFGNCYRYDRPQKGRYREFKQAGCELIGTSTPEALAELIALAYYNIKNIGIKEINLRIGNLEILKIILQKYNIDKKAREYITPLIDKEEYDELKNALEDFEISSEIIEDFIELLQKSSIDKIKKIIKEDKEAEIELDKLNQIIKYLKKGFNITDFKIDLSIVRGLDYYSGMVFEIEAPSLGAEKQICGGGSYELIELFGGTPTPTSGFAIGFDRSIVALEQQKKTFPDKKIDYFIASVTEDNIEYSLKVANKLRNSGFVVDIDLMRRGVGKSLKYASSINAQKSIIIGPEEIQKGKLTVRDMKTGKQESKKLDDIVK